MLFRSVALELPVSLPSPRTQEARFSHEFADIERRASEALGIVTSVTESAK